MGNIKFTSLKTRRPYEYYTNQTGYYEIIHNDTGILADSGMLENRSIFQIINAFINSPVILRPYF